MWLKFKIIGEVCFHFYKTPTHLTRYEMCLVSVNGTAGFSQSAHGLSWMGYLMGSLTRCRQMTHGTMSLSTSFACTSSPRAAQPLRLTQLCGTWGITRMFTRNTLSRHCAFVPARRHFAFFCVALCCFCEELLPTPRSPTKCLKCRSTIWWLAGHIRPETACIHPAKWFVCY
jgi:hypothetical protein